MGKLDDRRDNAQNIKEHISNTQENITNTQSTIAETDDENLRAELKEKNKRREEAIDSFQNELEDEIDFKSGI